MAEEQPHITEETYNTILAENRKHGRTLAVDLYVAEKYGGEVFVAPPKNLPAAVRPENPFRLYIPSKREPIEDVESEMHGKRVWYERVYDHDKLAVIDRHDGDQVTGSIDSIGAHYHVSRLDHYHRNFGLGRAIMGLGRDIEGFDGAMGAMHRQTLLFTGELKQEEPVYQSEKLPPSDLGIATLKEFIMGFRDGVREFKADMVERVELLLDRLPVL